ncbi:isoprenoid synthase domain-containing protein [Corynascus novoguineensis]|uniref:Terpene synthase n=1 Tax=Corynascus novoguineensis TaxID=1126955 RepID=A0AAN7CPM0_9PEZI|nr:isoprenoid synthase domain-containing protein [Corynascus novoguineensis]
MSLAVNKIRLPPLESIWRWPRYVSPHLADVEEECLQWSASFGAFDPETQRLIHDYGKLKQLRSGCDLMHLFFMFDEYSDQSSPEEVWRQASIQIDALCHPNKPRPKGEWVGGEIARQFWLRLPKTATKTFKRRFLETWIDYVESVAQQAEHRSESRILDLESYFLLRRHTSGAPSTIALCEMDMDIPDYVREHPILRLLETLAVDLIVIGNDLLSYNKEQAVGDDEHNIVTVIMAQFGVGVQEAIDRAGELSREKTDRFNALYGLLPRWVGPVDLDVQRLADGMAQCVSGVLHWSYESHRYFGTRGLVVKRTRTLRLLPRTKNNMKSTVKSTGAVGALGI